MEATIYTNTSSTTGSTITDELDLGTTSEFKKSQCYISYTCRSTYDSQFFHLVTICTSCCTMRMSRLCMCDIIPLPCAFCSKARFYFMYLYVSTSVLHLQL